MFKALIGTILGIIVLFAIGFGMNYADWANNNFFAPKYEHTRNKVFHESQAYNDGMVRDLENLQMEYTKASPDEKIALRAVILHRFSIYPEDRMPANLQVFYDQLKSAQ